MPNIFDQFDAPSVVPDPSMAPAAAAPPIAAPAAPSNVFDQFDTMPQPASASAPAQPDWSKYNKPFGELKPATPSFTEYIKQKAQDTILAAGTALGGKPDPYMARHVGGGAVDVAGLTPMGSILAAGDVGTSLAAGHPGRAAIEAIGAIPIAVAGKRLVQGMSKIPMADIPKVPMAGGADELKAAANTAYDAVRASPVVYHPSMLDDMINNIRVQLTQRGLNPVKAPSTFAVLDAASASRPRGAIVTPDDLDTVRQQLRGGVPGTQDSLAGGLAIEHLDRSMAQPLPQHVISGTQQDLDTLGRDLATARGNYRAYKTADTIEGKINTAEIRTAVAHSGKNLDNTTRQYLAGLLTTKTGQRAMAGARADELAAVEAASRGDWLTNAQRSASKYLGGGGGLGQYIASATGGGVGTTAAHFLGADPLTAGAIGAMSTGGTMALGTGLRTASEARTVAAAGRAADIARRNSPEYAARALATPPVPDPMAMRRDAITYALIPQLRSAGTNIFDQQMIPYANRPEE